MRKISVIAVLIIVLTSMVSCKKNNSGDTTAPVITLIGSPQVYVDKGTSYTDAGATAYDETDGDITSRIVVVNPVDANTEGTYYVSYDVTDEAGNKATEVKRKVVVMVF
ncbi:MAG TPA: DUF5011 domain-containing protein [Bacteroidales bacterium]|jgi:hypothetical protein|nr:DUF5011 domain-containing protein [Bacteroidales bacterium]HPB25036.1 DUF5011 domain-containing protein [Bacteroidales bacterium]HPI29683.1 DUF5011 domain-containing protein [Bacteroidales bacterium]HQN15354.1 DUF5011 domain-containing protein [Bacteroidales bacterium]HQP15519.1 DUF5011 domain-containing protein [Bacteroidales bacterium]